jgi:hypothetical protein
MVYRYSTFGNTALVAKVKPSRGIAMVFAVWFLYLLVKTGLTAAFS